MSQPPFFGGRPPVPVKGSTVSVYLRVPDHDRLIALARRTGLSVSAIARHTAFHVAPLLYRDTLALADSCRGNLLLASENVGTKEQKIPESVG